MKSIYYYTDMGSIKIGTKDFYVLVPNRIGDGSYWLHVLEKKEIYKHGKNEFVLMASISVKKASIYEYDLGEKEILELEEGNYNIYANKGTILVKEI